MSPDDHNFEPFRAIWRFWRLETEELFTVSDEELDRQAASFCADGFTHLMTFMAHFRLSYRRDFPRLTALLRRMVQAAHRHGLKIVEHHSANLLWCFDTPEAAAEARSQNDMGAFPHLEEDCGLQSAWDGEAIGGMCQISGDTGLPVLSFMNSRILCHNNPGYLKRYLDYLATLYETGIDGIMTDDIQFVSAARDPELDFDMDSCACPHCRRKFTAETGFVLPENGDAWRQFQRRRDTPCFMAWKRFRYESTLRFHREVVRHYDALGLKMLRPNYTATSASWANPWAFVLDDLPRLDWVFVEHCCGALRYSWPEYLVESAHVQMIARQRRIPAMALYYPLTSSQQRLGWALSLYSGMRYFGDPRSRTLFPEQKSFHAFETAHEKTLFGGDAVADTGLWDSQMARELQPDYNTTARFRFNSIAQSLLMNNVPWKMVSPDHPEEYGSCKLIIIAGMQLISDEQLRDLGASAARLMVVDDAGCRRLDGALRPEGELLAMLNPHSLPGKIIRVRPGELSAPFYRRCNTGGNGRRDAFNCSEPQRWRLWTAGEEAASARLAAFVRAQLPAPAIELLDAPQRMLVSAFSSPDGLLSIRIVNACGTLVPPAEPGYGDKDEVIFGSPSRPVRIRIRRHGLRRLRLSTLEDGQCDLEPENGEDGLCFSIPAKFLREFALLSTIPDSLT